MCPKNPSDKKFVQLYTAIQGVSFPPYPCRQSDSLGGPHLQADLPGGREEAWLVWKGQGINGGTIVLFNRPDAAGAVLQTALSQNN